MSKSQASVTDRNQTRSDENRAPDTGPRARLLASLPVAERRLQLNGVSTTVLEGGEGPPVVLLHGPGDYAAKWLRVIPDLVTTHTVVAPDLPGHGASEAFGGAIDAARLMGWVDDLIECTCPTPPALVGHVLGGAIAARFATDRSERLSALVLVDALGLAPFRPTPDFGEALTGFLSDPTEHTHDLLWNECAFDLRGMCTQLGEHWEWIKAYNLDLARRPAQQAALHELMERFGFPAIPPEDLARVTVPTSLIWGRHDHATELPVAEAASARHGWPLRVVENAADDPAMEQPEAFLKALREAIGDTPATAPRHS